MKRSPLHIATLKNNLTMVDFLLSCGANINCQDIDLNTPLHLAAKLGYERLTDYLIKRNADFMIKNSYQEKAFDICCNINIYKVSLQNIKQTKILNKPNSNAFQNRL